MSIEATIVAGCDSPKCLNVLKEGSLCYCEDCYMELLDEIERLKAKVEELDTMLSEATP